MQIPPAFSPIVPESGAAVNRVYRFNLNNLSLFPISGAGTFAPQLHPVARLEAGNDSGVDIK
jgi:hypothetical protein